jgi:glycosyltransferase involved in cell wall biosynthesis
VWPSDGANEHPPEHVTPRAENLDLRMVASSSRQVNATDGKAKTFLPSREAWSALQGQDVRAVLIHEFSPFTLQGLVFAKLRRIPVVVSTEVGRSNAHFFNSRTRLWHGFWGRFVDGIAACCPAAHRPISRKRVPTLATYHAVDSRIYQPIQRTRPAAAPTVFAYLGQLIPRKGLDLLLDAAVVLRARGHDDFTLRFIGGGDDAWLREGIERRGMESHCELTGFLSGSAIREALGSADVFVLPTRQDTYAAVVHEAACLGLPLLVSRHAGAAEALVREGSNGRIIDPEDIESFAATMAEMLDPAVRARMSGPSREAGESHSAHERGRALWNWLHDDILHAAKDASPISAQVRA